MINEILEGNLNVATGINPQILQENNMAQPGFSHPPVWSFAGLWLQASLPAIFLQQTILAALAFAIPGIEERNNIQPISKTAMNFIKQIY